MRIESKKYLYDIVRAAKLALGFTAGKTFADYSADIMLRSAVERQLEIVGEALTQLAKTDPAAASQIGEYQRIIAFRNILIHGYAEIDHRIVWNVLELKLPVVLRQSSSLLGDNDLQDLGAAQRAIGITTERFICACTIHHIREEFYESIWGRGRLQTPPSTLG